MAKIGVITFSDGRRNVHESTLEMNLSFQNALVGQLEKAGHTVVVADEIPWSNELARGAGQKMAASRVDMTIFNYAIWSWPHFTAIAAQFAPGPFLCFSNVNPSFPGLVGMLASSGALANIGVPYKRIVGDIGKKKVLAKVLAWVGAAAAVAALKGETMGVFGGRPMGMYTATSGTDQWMAQFGVDVEHIDQWEIVRRAGEVPKKKVENALKWCKANVGKIIWDEKQLTEDHLRRQIASYYAVRQMVEEMHLDFCGIKGQPELTNNWCTMDVPEAFLNDPYDFDGPKDIIVCSTEADMDAALTMEIFKHLAKTPVLFADVRHFFEKEGLWDFVNSGQHATYFAAKSFDPKDNMPHVTFYPEGFYFPAGGASVQHLAAPGRVTLARLGRRNGRYWMAILPGEFLQFDKKKNDKLMRETQIEWPHAFFKPDGDNEEIIDDFPCNHIHGVYGDFVEELCIACELLDVEYEVYA